MLQKFSKCEVKAFQKSDHLTATQIFRENKFSQIQTVQKCHLWQNLRLRTLVGLGLESCSYLLKSKFRTSKIAKNDIFGLFECTKM